MTQRKHWKWLRNRLLKQERDMQDKLTLVRDNRRRIEAKLQRVTAARGGAMTIAELFATDEAWLADIERGLKQGVGSQGGNYFYNNHCIGRQTVRQLIDRVQQLHAEVATLRAQLSAENRNSHD